MKIVEMPISEPFANAVLNYSHRALEGDHLGRPKPVLIYGLGPLMAYEVEVRPSRRGTFANSMFRMFLPK